MITILTEKKEVATLYAKVLGFKQNKGYYQKDDTYLTWASGHFIGLADPKEYDPKYEKWDIVHLPIIPEKMKYDLVQGHKQFKIIKNLFQKSDSIINASDPGREGELIFRLIYNYTGVKKPVQRMWTASRTAKSIKAAYNNLLPISNYTGLYIAALSRMIFDWLVGINLTRLMTKKLDLGRAYHIGRVQTPTLRIICERYLAHINFKPESFWKPELVLKYQDQQFKATSETRYTEIEEAQKVVNAVSLLKEIDLVNSEIKAKSEMPPQLYDIAELQGKANNVFGYTLDQTLSIAQSLYMKGVTTYPRTDSRYLPEDMKNTMPDLLRSMSGVPELNGSVQCIDTNNLVYSNRYFDDTKLTDHFAIIPTGKVSNDLTEQEQNVFLLVASSIVMAFLPDCQKETTAYYFNPSSFSFKSSGTVTKEPGWRIAELFKQTKKEEVHLPILPEGCTVDLLEVLNETKHTKAPELLTDTGVVKLMKHAGKLVDDTNTEEMMNKFGLGTGATRDGILKNIVDRGYAFRKAKKVIPTDAGLFLYEQTKDLSISDVELTGKWEYSLRQIEEGNLKPVRFKNEIQSYVKDIVSQIKSKEIDRNSQLHVCPKCQAKTMVKKARLLDCSNETCDFQLWFKIAGKQLTSKQINDLLNNGKTSKIKGFKKKDGDTFETALAFCKDFKIIFIRNDKRRKRRKKVS